MTIRKPILCLDFDGVLHSYTSGWAGADLILDDPTPGAMAFVMDALDHFTVAIFSSRSNAPGGIEAMKQWLAYHLELHIRKEHGLGGSDLRESQIAVLTEIQWPTEKPPALVTLDDRAVTFTGNFPGLAELRAFQPWNKRPEADRQIDALVDEQQAKLRRFVAQIDAMPEPDAMCEDATAYVRGKLLKQIADALR